MKSRKRESSFELLRILSMFIIIIWHVGRHGVESYIEPNNLNVANEFIYYFLKSLTVIAVNIYVLISGYFQSQTTFKWKKVLDVFMETTIFMLFIHFILSVIGVESFSIPFIAKAFFSVFNGTYWFVSVYVVLYILSPYINVSLNGLNKSGHANLVTILFFINSVWQYVFAGVNLGVNFGMGLFHFIFLYVLAAYIRRYEYFLKEFNKWFYLLLYGSLALLVTLINLYTSNNVERVYSYNSPFIVLMACAVFMVFKKTTFHSNTINRISPFVFGIYLVHEHPNMREYLWQKSPLINWIVEGSDTLFVVRYLIVGILIFLCSLGLSAVITKSFNLFYAKIDDFLISRKKTTKETVNS